MNASAPPLPQSFARFAAIGTIGFIIDAGVLSLLALAAGWPVLPARLVSISLAITTTWLTHRRFTFARGTLAAHVEYAGSFAIQLAGVCLNLGIFVLCLHWWPHLERWPVLPQAAGSLVALVFNSLVARRASYSTLGAETR